VEASNTPTIRRLILSRRHQLSPIARAGETKSERHRQALLEMARTWIQAALEVERGLGTATPLHSFRPAK
jgi:hypothetical protein